MPSMAMMDDDGQEMIAAERGECSATFPPYW